MFDENIAPSNVKKGKSGNGGKAKSVEETYTKKTPLEHILLRPDTYIGSIVQQSQQMWVYDQITNSVVHKSISYVPGLYKIFDEIIVNAADNKQRDPTMNRIEVEINADENYVRVWNNGSGIPVVVHQEHGIYVPELIFGNLLTGSNFDDDEEKTTGGRNGYGSKLANIFSTKFIIETADKANKKKYKQVFSNNMQNKTEPEISSHNSSDYTCVTFFPDLKRFKMNYLDDDIVSLFSKRVYDIAGTAMGSGSKLQVYLNGVRIEAKNFEQYISLYSGIEEPCSFEKVGDRWEIGVGVSDGSFQQVSFVNSISTTKGGGHVTYIADQIIGKLSNVVKKKNKGTEVSKNQIKNHLAIYVNALIVNPAFDSQTKENLTTKSSNFGSKCEVSDKMIKAIEKSGIVDNILSYAKFKQTEQLKRKGGGGAKRSKLLGVPKLDDANCAGSSKSDQCTLILTEGDSAKSFAVSGLGVVGRDYYGVFPLKGKLLNVREASHAQMMKNEEIQNIAKILGLSFGKKYTDTKDLRYGHLMIMTDQDHDGSHIKGLLINFLHHFWPTLLKIDGFLQQFITPIVKCTKGKKEVIFYTIPEYHGWKETNNNGNGWKIKYYKGLGTSTAAEAKDYFSNLQTSQVDFEWDAQADDVIDMAFSKKRVEDRKLWLLSMKKGVHIDYTAGNITYDKFVNNELILFSQADNERSLPSFVDGLKPSQRKVLYSCFKRNLKHEIKVAQLAGYVSEHSAYHHGEVSLTGTIINMAQNFVGSNNINLLTPSGQFGTRLMGGKDAASPRYIFTKLESIARHIFHPHDDPLLEYLEDDGQTIEPLCYVPVIPMILVNGADGIGTGYSTSVPNYNPRDIITSLRQLIRGGETETLVPWYRGFDGEIVRKTNKDVNNFHVYGSMEQLDDKTLLISELPLGKWTSDYKAWLESMLIGNQNVDKEKDGPAQFIKDFKENHTDTTVSFTVTLNDGVIEKFDKEPGGLIKKFKLEGSLATTNMCMFDLNQQIRKFDSTDAILSEFFKVRLQLYDQRKLHLIDKLTEEWECLDNKMKFIMSVINGSLVVSNRKKADIVNDLQKQGFRVFKDSSKGRREDTALASASTDSVESGDERSDSATDSSSKGYDYLLSMKIWSLTKEKVTELQRQRDEKRAELDIIIAKSAEDMWEDDLLSLSEALDTYEEAISAARVEEAKAQKKAQKYVSSSRSKKPIKNAKKKSYDSDDDSDEDVDGDDSDFDDYAKKPKKKTVAPKPLATVQTSKTILPKPIVAKAPAQQKEKEPLPKKEKVSKEVCKTVDTSVDQFEGLSLMDRIKAKQAREGGASLNSSGSLLKHFPPASSNALSSHNAMNFIDLCEADEEAAPAPKAKAPARAAATKKKKAYVESDSEEDALEESEEESFSSDQSFEATPKKKKAASTAKAVAKPVQKVPSKKAAEATQKKGTKRSVKSSSQPSILAAMGLISPAKEAAKTSDAPLFSPGVPTPQPVKKSRPAKKASPPAKKAKPPAAKATKVVKAPAKKTSKKIQDSDSEAEFDEEEEVVPKARPARQRSQIATYVVDDSFIDEDEEEDFSEEDVEEDSDEDFED